METSWLAQRYAAIAGELETETSWLQSIVILASLVRPDNETAVSVIAGAITLQQIEANNTQYRQRSVIPYCTIGGRSGWYARQLSKEGHTVENYRGSILDWVQHGLPLVALAGESTRQVHTYDQRYRVPEGDEQVIR